MRGPRGAPWASVCGGPNWWRSPSATGVSHWRFAGEHGRADWAKSDMGQGCNRYVGAIPPGKYMSRSSWPVKHGDQGEARCCPRVWSGRCPAPLRSGCWRSRHRTARPPAQLQEGALPLRPRAEQQEPISSIPLRFPSGEVGQNHTTQRAALHRVQCFASTRTGQCLGAEDGGRKTARNLTRLVTDNSLRTHRLYIARIVFTLPCFLWAPE
jgi:hypothetical protein